MNYINSLITNAVSYVSNYEYGELAIKVVVKSAKFIIVNGIEFIQYLN